MNEEKLLEIMEHSYKNFHVRGFDYICLHRSPDFTHKVYFFDGDVEQLPEVVNPHNHRYSFATRVFTGKLIDRRYMTNAVEGDVFQAFDWKTPLNGGDGFTWREETRLKGAYTHELTPQSDAYYTPFDEIHTIKIAQPGTVIELTQYSDALPLDMPTQTFMQNKLPPSLEGLYEKFTADEVLARVETIKQLGGIIL